MSEELKNFTNEQLAHIGREIAKLKIMQAACLAGGELFKERLEKIQMELGSNLAVEDELIKQFKQLG